MTTDSTSSAGSLGGPPAPPPPQPRRQLHRSSSDKLVAGVCGGLGRYTGVDPVVFRITLGVLSVFAGTGIVLYGLAWLLIPAEGTNESEAQRLMRGRGSAGTIVAVIAAIVGASLLLDVLRKGVGHSAELLLVLAAIATVIVLMRRGHHGEPASPVAHAAAGGGGDDAGDAPSSYVDLATLGAPGTSPEHLGYPTAEHPAPPGGAALWAVEPGGLKPRQRNVLAPLTFSITLVVMGVLLGLQASGGLSLPVAVVLAAALTVVGAGLVVGAWRGRGRGLITIGALLAGALILTASLSGVLRGVPVTGGWGDRTWPASGTTATDVPYRLGAGKATLDLSDLTLAGGYRTIEASVAFGQLAVTVPRNVDVVVQAHSGVGALHVLGTDASGSDVDRTVNVPATSSPSAGTVYLNLRVGIGEVEVNHAQP